MAAVSPDELLALRDIVVKDTLALQKWGQVVDRIVISPADALGIKRTLNTLNSLNDGSFEEAVLHSLRLFYSRGGSRSELADVLRSESIGLNTLAERIQEPPTTSSTGTTTTLQATRVALWDEVTMIIQSRLADCLRRTGNSRRAVQIYDEIIPVAERAFGEKDPSVLLYKYNKAKALVRLGKLDQSLELLHHVHAKYVSMYGENYAKTLRTKDQIAFLHYDKKEFTKALEIWEETEAGYKHVLGHTHQKTVTVRNNIALCKVKLSQRANRASHCQIL